jgi:hypothetical protein
MQSAGCSDVSPNSVCNEGEVTPAARRPQPGGMAIMSGSIQKISSILTCVINASWPDRATKRVPAGDRR